MTGTLSKDNITIDMNTFTEGLVSKGISFEMNGGLPTPTGKTRTVYNYTGSNQSLDTSSINYVFAKCWGAGGGGGTGGGGEQIFFESENAMDSDYAISSNHNALVAGPLTINATLTINSPSVVTIP